MKLRKLAALAVGGATLLCTTSAMAMDPAEVKDGFSIAGLIGYGMYGFDLGVRGGYTLPNGVYLGGTFIFNSGFAGWGAGFTTGFEGGYAFAAGPVLVRPYGGVGVALEQYDGYYYAGYNPTLCAEGIDDAVTCNAGYGGGTQTSFAFWIGGTAIYNFKGGPWFVAADIRIEESPALYTSQFGVSFMPGGGVQF